MSTRDLLLVIGFLRSGQMFPSAVPLKALPAHRSLRIVHDAMAEQEMAMFGKPSRPPDDGDIKRRAAITSWGGDVLSVGTRIEEVPDPGVILCLFYDGPVETASLPVDVFAQTLRRFALRDKVLRAKFDQHVDEAATYVPAWLSPEVRRKKSQEQFEQAMKVAREQGFASAAPLFEGVRGECFAEAQLAIAVYETRELANISGALARLGEVVRVAPRNLAARMQRAALYRRDPGRQVEASADYLHVLRLLALPQGIDPSRSVKEAATQGLWELNAEFAEPAALEAARELVRQDGERGFDALSRYAHTHPCSWDAQVELARLALTRQRFDLAAKLLKDVRWLFPEDPSAHFVYGQALAASGLHEAALRALDYASRLAPDDADIRSWIVFAKKELSAFPVTEAEPASVAVAHHVARSLLVLRGVVWHGRVYPAAMNLHKVPGDVSMAFVLQAAAGQEQQRAQNGGDAETELRRLGERAELTDYAGEILSPDNTVGDLSDPGVVLVVLYESPSRDAEGKPILEPPPSECRTRLLNVIAHDSELSAKVDRHLKSHDANLKARLEL